MNAEDRIAKLESEIERLRAAFESRTEHLYAENDRADSMMMAACEQINVIHKRVDDTEHRLGVIKYILDEIGDKLYPVFYKVFPGMVQAEEALKRAVQQAGKAPKE